MAKKDREKKRAERAENATPQNIARKEERAKEKKEAEEKLARGKGLMTAAMASLVLATFALLFADIARPSFSGSLKMFAYGITVAAGGSLMASSRYAAKTSKKWLLLRRFGGDDFGHGFIFRASRGHLILGEKNEKYFKNHNFADVYLRHGFFVLRAY